MIAAVAHSTLLRWQVCAEHSTETAWRSLNLELELRSLNLKLISVAVVPVSTQLRALKQRQKTLRTAAAAQVATQVRTAMQMSTSVPQGRVHMIQAALSPSIRIHANARQDILGRTVLKLLTSVHQPRVSMMVYAQML